ncbi:LysM peptidoglycan-binding domain-containing protein [Paenibacillus kobensis]|uniref:LysM peptidoglycan-binding domain-containing protein n=1 Tax=Paenibacillus kobensis TaxID=59841 RepID=UPI000FD9AB7F|nr:LysM peptidoglycan-binding domain-containing protein [Paenibacillus kobensis]
MSYGIWLSWDDQKEGFDLPVLPAEIGVEASGEGSEHEVQGLGKINVIKDRGLMSYSIESLFPAHSYPIDDSYFPFLRTMIPSIREKRHYYSSHYPYIQSRYPLQPKQYVDHIMRWWESKYPIHFIYVGDTMEINTPASIESFEWRESAGAPGDIEYKLKLKEYRYFSPQRATFDNNKLTKATAKRADERVPAKTYTIAAGDSLWKIAQKTLGNGSRWREIQALNGISDAQTKMLKIGTILKLPAVNAHA